MNLNADGQRQPGTYHRAFKNLPTVAGQRIKNPLPRRGAAPVAPAPATTQVPPPGASIPPPVCGVCQEKFQNDADELPCCKARVCGACAKEVVAIVTCPFCGGDPSPPPEEDCSNDAAIALALSRRWT